MPDGVADERLSLDQLGSRIVATAGRIAAATCRWLLLVADFDARDGCARFGLASTAQWLSHTCGLSRRTAIEHVRVARGLAAHPVLAQAMVTGRLSYSHARAITRLVRPGEDALVAELVQGAHHSSVHQLECLVRGLRTVEDNEHSDITAPPAEYVSHRTGTDGRWQLTAALDPERGAVVDAALHRLARSRGLTLTDAFIRMAEMTLAALADAEHPPRGLRSEERAAVVIYVDAAAIPPAADDPPAKPVPGRPNQPDRVAVRPFARIAGGPGLPRAVTERLLCAGRIRTALWRSSSPGVPSPGVPGPGVPTSGARTLLDLGRSHRVVSERQFRALLLRDQHCTHPGCTSTDDLQAHHIRHWLYGGPTDLPNLALLCPAHHHAHHDGAFTVRRLGDSTLEFTRKDGRILPHVVDPTALTDRVTPIEDEYSDVHASAATTRQSGDRLDHHYAISVLATNRRRWRADRRSSEPTGRLDERQVSRRCG